MSTVPLGDIGPCTMAGPKPEDKSSGPPAVPQPKEPADTKYFLYLWQGQVIRHFNNLLRIPTPRRVRVEYAPKPATISPPPLPRLCRLLLWLGFLRPIQRPAPPPPVPKPPPLSLDYVTLRPFGELFYLGPAGESGWMAKVWFETSAGLVEDRMHFSLDHTFADVAKAIVSHLDFELHTSLRKLAGGVVR